MKVEAHIMTGIAAEAAQAKAEARLLLEENGRLREAMVQARQCIDADDVIGAHAIIVAVLEGKRVGWVNIYDNTRRGKKVYPSKDQAIAGASPGRIATIKIELEE